MHFGLLGPLAVLDDEGRTLELGRNQPRMVLAVLLAARGRVVPAEPLVSIVGGDDPPATAHRTLKRYVSRLRRQLEPVRGRGEEARILQWEPPGYRYGSSARRSAATSSATSSAIATPSLGNRRRGWRGGGVPSLDRSEQAVEVRSLRQPADLDEQVGCTERHHHHARWEVNLIGGGVGQAVGGERLPVLADVVADRLQDGTSRQPGDGVAGTGNGGRCRFGQPPSIHGARSRPRRHGSRERREVGDLLIDASDGADIEALQRELVGRRHHGGMPAPHEWRRIAV